MEEGRTAWQARFVFLDSLSIVVEHTTFPGAAETTLYHLTTITTGRAKPNHNDSRG